MADQHNAKIAAGAVSADAITQATQVASNSQQQQGWTPQTTNTVSSAPEREKCLMIGKYRYDVTIVSLVALALGVCVLQALATHTYWVVRLLVMPGTGLFALFCYEWVYYFSESLTRRKQAFFDVKNVIETYQPRRNTEEALLFQPDPPTPDVLPSSASKSKVKTETATQPTGQAAPVEDFRTWRNQHYSNEFVGLPAMISVPNEDLLYNGLGQLQQRAAAADGQQTSKTASKDKVR